MGEASIRGSCRKWGEGWEWWAWSIMPTRPACVCRHGASCRRGRPASVDFEQPPVRNHRASGRARTRGEATMLDIVLVDDHKLVRDGIKGILERGSEFRVVGEAESGADAVNLCKKTQPHIALMDIGLPGMNGIEATTELLRHCPTVKVIILSMYDDENSVVSAIRSGARAFVLKKASSTELLDALRTVARGGSYLSSQVSDRLLARIQRGDLDTHDRSPLESLSPRELQVLRLVAEGKTSKD